MKAQYQGTGHQAWSVRAFVPALVLGLALVAGHSARADVTLVRDNNTRTMLYEVKPTQPFYEGFVSEPIQLPTRDAPVMVITGVASTNLFDPGPGLGSASVTMTYHSAGFGFNPDNGALSWAGVNADGSPIAGLVRLPNGGDPNWNPFRGYLLLASRDALTALIPGPKPNEFRVIGRQNQSVMVRLMW